MEVCILEEQAERLLTHAQQRILYGEEFFPGSNFANLAVTFVLPDEVNSAILNQAVNAVLESDDGFRLQLKVDVVSGRHVQYTAPFSQQHFPVTDFADDQQRFAEWIAAQVAQAFALYNQPLYRILPARCQGCLQLLLVVHHAVCDNGSLYQFINKVTGFCSDISAGREVVAEKHSYFDYLDSEIAYLQSAEVIVDGAYWQAKFSELPEYSSLYGKETLVNDIAAKRTEFFLPSALAERLRIFCEDHTISYFRVFATTFAVWLARCTGRYDMALGGAVSQPSRPGQ